MTPEEFSTSVQKMRADRGIEAREPMTAREFITAQLSSGYPKTVADLARMGRTMEPVIEFDSLRSCVDKMLKAKQIEPVAGFSKTVGDGVYWREKRTMASGPVARAYRLTGIDQMEVVRKARVNRMTIKNPTGDVYRHNWTKQAREQLGYPEETEAQVIERLKNAGTTAAENELAKMTKEKA